jgi:hypothetical protein
MTRRDREFPHEASPGEAQAPPRPRYARLATARAAHARVLTSANEYYVINGLSGRVEYLMAWTGVAGRVARHYEGKTPGTG